MAGPIKPPKPIPCEKCGAAMDRTALPRTLDEAEAETRLVCPRCGHEVVE